MRRAGDSSAQREQQTRPDNNVLFHDRTPGIRIGREAKTISGRLDARAPSSASGDQRALRMPELPSSATRDQPARLDAERTVVSERDQRALRCPLPSSAS